MIRTYEFLKVNELVIETSPDQRYLKTNVKLGTGGFKTVNKGYDSQLVREVAWNELKSQGSVQKIDTLLKEISLLQKLSHPNILSFFDWWHQENNTTINGTLTPVTSSSSPSPSPSIYDLSHNNNGVNNNNSINASGVSYENTLIQRMHSQHHSGVGGSASRDGSVLNQSQVVFITEMMSGGTLKEYLKRIDYIKPRTIQNWALQILSGLKYLHNHDPKVIHRDLKCDNIFINIDTNEIKIGDMGLATIKGKGFAETVIGTPAFMAPEMYEEYYSEKVDIYAFGMCLLEMFTGEYPYEKECSNPAQIFKRVTQGLKPQSLELVINDHARYMISNCIIHDPEHRWDLNTISTSDFLTADQYLINLDDSHSHSSKLRNKLSDVDTDNSINKLSLGADVINRVGEFHDHRNHLEDDNNLGTIFDTLNSSHITSMHNTFDEMAFDTLSLSGQHNESGYTSKIDSPTRLDVGQEEDPDDLFLKDEFASSNSGSSKEPYLGIENLPTSVANDMDVRIYYKQEYREGFSMYPNGVYLHATSSPIMVDNSAENNTTATQLATKKQLQQAYEGLLSDVELVEVLDDHTIQLMFTTNIRISPENRDTQFNIDIDLDQSQSHGNNDSPTQPKDITRKNSSSIEIKVQKKAIHFPFDLDLDTPFDIVQEMAATNIVLEKDLHRVLTGIEKIVHNADWVQLLEYQFELKHEFNNQLLNDRFKFWNLLKEAKASEPTDTNRHSIMHSKAMNYRSMPAKSKVENSPYVPATPSPITQPQRPQQDLISLEPDNDNEIKTSAGNFTSSISINTNNTIEDYDNSQMNNSIKNKMDDYLPQFSTYKQQALQNHTNNNSNSSINKSSSINNASGMSVARSPPSLEPYEIFSPSRNSEYITAAAVEDPKVINEQQQLHPSMFFPTSLSLSPLAQFSNLPTLSELSEEDAYQLINDDQHIDMENRHQSLLPIEYSGNIPENTS